MPPVFHHNHLMRFVPLIPSNLDPSPWRPFPAAELAWTGALHLGWLTGPQQVHAVHLPACPWTDALGDQVLQVLRPKLELDFLVIPATCPRDRMAHANFMTVLEGLLEVTHGMGVKLALRPGPGEAEGLVKLLKEARGEAVGFCWDTHTPGDLDCVADRLFCAVGEPLDDFAPLQRLGYRWNLALPAEAPDPLLGTIASLEKAFPPVLFPADLTSAPRGPQPPLERP